MRVKLGIQFGQTWGNIDDDRVLDFCWLATKLLGSFSAAIICSTSYYK